MVPGFASQRVAMPITTLAATPLMRVVRTACLLTTECLADPADSGGSPSTWKAIARPAKPIEANAACTCQMTLLPPSRRGASLAQTTMPRGLLPFEGRWLTPVQLGLRATRIAAVLWR